MPLLRRTALSLALAGLAAPSLARAATARPVTLIVPFAPGGSADVLARVLGPAIGEQLGQTVVVELKPGAGGNIGAAYVASQARPDGHTLLLASTSLATSVSMAAIPFDPLRDLVPVAGIGAIPSLLVVSPDAPYRDLAGLLAAARSMPGRISYGSSGLATASHLSGVLLGEQAGVELLHVPYRGSGAVYPDLIAGRINFLLDVMGSSAGQVQQGAVRAIGTSAAARTEAFPEVPTIAEQGVPGFEFATWFGLFARTGTPPELRLALEQAALAALAAPAVRARLQQVSAQPVPGSGEAFDAYFRADARRWAALVEAGKLERVS